MRVQTVGEQTTETKSFLPNFCALRMVFGVVVLLELFAFILVLAGSKPSERWTDLALISLFVQWAGLLGASLLCLGRRFLAPLGDTVAGVSGYLLLLAMILVLSEAAYRVLDAGMPGSLPGRADFLFRNAAIGAIVTGIVLRYFYMANQWRRQMEAEATARFHALQARIRPHFLFNALNTAAALVHERPDTAEAALEDLADLFRATLKDDRSLVPLAEEWDLTRRYAAIEALRLGARLQLEWDIEPEAEALPLPPLTLQPLVENAVYHGIEPLAKGGTVRVMAWREAGWLVLEVVNPCSTPRPGGQGNRMALDNTRQRLQARFGETAALEAWERDGQHHVKVRVPVVEVAE